MTRQGKRRGAAIVEMAAVVVVFLLLLFGIIEWCRFIFVRQVFFNAAREGGRYAAVNIIDTSVVADTQDWVKKYMANVDKQLTGYKCDVYKADATGKNIASADLATFGEYVCVDLQADYAPLLPSFLYMNKTFKLRCQTMMYSEAN